MTICCGKLEQLRDSYPLSVNIRTDQSGKTGFAFHCWTTEPLGILHRPVFVLMDFCPICGKQLGETQDVTP